MCGIIGAVTQENVTPILLSGLKSLEYRGYDSAGIAVITNENQINRIRVEGKVQGLEEKIAQKPLYGSIGIAHTRWATHGKPNESNAHPHIIHNRIVLVHNGIIENYLSLKEDLLLKNYKFDSETDSEVAAALIYDYLLVSDSLLSATQKAAHQLEGAFAICVIDKEAPDTVIVIRKGSPVVLGISPVGHYVASDSLALQGVAASFVYLEDGDSAVLTKQHYAIYNDKKQVHRTDHKNNIDCEAVDKGQYKHFMLKEIFEQPKALHTTLKNSITDSGIIESSFGAKAAQVFDATQAICLVGCGTSYHSGLIARFWLEELAHIPTQVEIASEFRYRSKAIPPNTLLVCISQSGETADTLAALKSTKNEANYCGRLAICNVLESSLQRESELFFYTQAGPEIGVCSTKAFTSQLIALMLLTIALGRKCGITPEKEQELISLLENLPSHIESFLNYYTPIQTLAKSFLNKNHALFLGRGVHFPVALEGALKLKEISYIHAEAYPAGELKHGPLALVDNEMLVIVLAPSNHLLEKIKSNIQEVHARGGQLIVFTDSAASIPKSSSIQVIEFPRVAPYLEPFVYTIPLQLLAYQVALLKGTDVDQPRNLAKSVTVE